MNVQKKLDQEENGILQQSTITIEEASIVLKNMANDKSPGTSGFTTEFYKTFWKQLGNHLVNSLNYSYKIDKLPTTQCEGVITCIPKSDKDKRFLKNWRPISLLNIGYKILSGIIARRIKKFLPMIINPDQTGFMQGRFIGDNIRTIYDTLNYAKATKKTWYVITD